MHRHLGFKRFYGLGTLLCAQVCGFYAMAWLCSSVVVHRHVGFKRIHGVRSQLLCTGIWVLSEFNVMSEIGNSSYVHRHVGFERFHGLGGLLLCTGHLECIVAKAGSEAAPCG